MMRSREEISRALAERGIHLTAQRLAIAEFVLNRTDHPSADDVFRAVSAALPVVSKATVYNTLNLLVRERLLQALTLQEGAVRYDPLLASHAHFLDTRTHRVVDIPPDRVRAVEHELDPARFEIEEVQVIFRGRIRDGEPDAG
jgi:Fur family peroxide stress response transcriptional regulator